LGKEKAYQLYVGNQCSSCERIITYLENKKITISVINIDNEDYDLPFSLMVIPALVNGERLLCYGADIEKYIDKNFS